MEKKKRRWPWILAAVLVLGLAISHVRIQYFGPMTCGSSEADMIQYVEQKVAEKGFDRAIEVRKTAQAGRVQAMLYEEYPRSDPGDRFRCIIIFERQLFGLRLRQVGMNGWEEGELYLSGNWGGGRCVVEVYGDNRDGKASGYSVTDAPEVCRENLESDYILDIYILDGIDHLPDRKNFQIMPAEER